MTDRRVLVYQGLFAAVDSAGDIHGTSGAQPDGLFALDARHLSLWQLTANGARLTQLSPGVLVPAGTRDRPPAYTLFREQAVDRCGLAESVRLVNNGARPLTVHLRYLADADFADQFELRSDDRSYPKPGAEHGRETTAHGVTFTYRRGNSWNARTVITSQPAPSTVTATAGPAVMHWEVSVPAHGATTVIVNIGAVFGTAATTTAVRAPEDVRASVRAELRTFVSSAPRPAQLTEEPALAQACDRGLTDLAALRISAPTPDGTSTLVPAAGVPWFLALFGRDSLLTSLFALPYRPQLAAATLLALAATQGTRHDRERIEQPGKIVHEVRHSELAQFEQVPYGRYYGAVDATPLFLVLLHAYTTHTGDLTLARTLEHHARAAIQWMFRYGGLNEHGYLVYEPDPDGLINQCWKDSADAICHSDGTQAEGPIAVCEAQGYAFDALSRTAYLSAHVWDDATFAQRLTDAASRLRADLHRDFLLSEYQGFPALALDGHRRQLATLSSNAAHLLWSGVLDKRVAATVGSRMLQPDFFSGWGIRTLAAEQHPYHPLSYHRGSIWPHDNAIVVLGLARYGLRKEATTVIDGLLAAAVHHNYRLPEVISGHARHLHSAPVPYPHACSPQAWAAASPLAFLTATSHDRS
ncbi:glycogen debranching N-terminal domain-containing protein [Streptomyces sp. NPDC007355]|uniref:amylo-alpha-1,6-glucosidase n=1 Tax=Streptomyces sp. NPDC007355 TaxID=3364778 RepID=UPI00368C0A8B